MMKALINLTNLIKLFLKWKDTPYAHMAQINELTIMAARRCAYDLKHASADIDILNSRCGEQSLINYYERANHWQEIFSPNGGKEYRHRLHQKIFELEFEITKLKKLLKDNNIPFQDNDDIPF